MIRPDLQLCGLATSRPGERNFAEADWKPVFTSIDNGSLTLRGFAGHIAGEKVPPVQGRLFNPHPPRTSAEDL